MMYRIAQLKILRRLPLTTILMIICLLSPPFVSAGAEEGTKPDAAILAEIHAAWKSREDKIESLSFTWNHQQTRRVKKLRKTEEGQPASTVPNQRELITYSQLTHFATEGDRVMYRYQVPDKFTDIRISKHYKGVYNGQRNQMIHFTHPPNVIVDQKSRAHDVDRVYVLPILFAYRPMRRNMARVDVNACVVDDQPISINGHSCLKLTHVLEPPSHTRSVWVAADMDYSVLRHTDTTGGRDQVTIDISYSKDGEWGWIPTHWETVWIDPQSGELTEAGVSNVTEYQFNKDIPAAEFQLKPPAGSIINDTAAKKHFVVAADGSKKEFTQDDVEQKKLLAMVEAESNRTDSASNDDRQWIWWSIGTAVVLLIAILAFVVVRQRLTKA